MAPNRLKSLCGIAKAAERAGDRARAREYHAKVLTTAASGDTGRPELQEARAFR